MKILYGVQGTGNGHISRARAMARALQSHPQLQVQWLFSGRSPEKLFGMEPFGDYWWREGLTFVHRGGRIDQLATARQLNPRQLIRDIRELPVRDFDLMITDFEPVTAWAAKRAGVPSLGLGHQYAFNFAIPAPRFNWMARAIMRAFAPAQHSLGMHWYHFGHPILPPIAQPHHSPDNGEHILVYLPFENHSQLLKELARLPQRFIVYGAPEELPAADNLELKAPSIDGFQRDLASARAVICNSGFELIAETLALGKPILTRPLSGQFEQEANARALNELQLATVVPAIDATGIRRWLDCQPTGVQIQWPDVAGSIAQWLASGRQQTAGELADGLWEQVVPGRRTNAVEATGVALD
ncbi:MJ1255/VC2487 family glycosyltransferase [Microbulbifer guangxiensis]|uniref:MJ1255/VC2487 family glycosyltransferase n=1 Tax=Microbulbifer guangxiensis TaxID=2904249 RepID=UPI001F2986E2|nr:MJ1255/VC2487 family glycosyltransferase [Microbulbifer guangxiensis]